MRSARWTRGARLGVPALVVAAAVAGRSTIEELFPKFNAEESALAAHLEPRQQDDLAAMLRSLLRAVTPSERDRPGPVA